jgi:hypothetical protein
MTTPLKHPITVGNFDSVDELADYIKKEDYNIAPWLVNRIFLDTLQDKQRWYVRLAWLWIQLGRSLQKTNTWKRLDLENLWEKIWRLRYDVMAHTLWLLDLPVESIADLESMWVIAKPYMKNELEIYPEVQL